MSPNTKKLVIIISLVIVFLFIAMKVVFYFRYVEVPVLKQNVEAGTQVSPAMLTTVKIPQQGSLLQNVATSATDLFTDGKISTTTGRYVNIPVYANQPIRKEVLIDSPKDTSINGGDGKTTLAVELAVSNAVGGVLYANSPQNTVNVIYAFSNSSSRDLVDNNNQLIIDPKTAMSVANVKVLDVRNDNGTRRFNASTATKKIIVVLALSNDDARQIALASGGAGMVYLTLSGGTTSAQIPVNSTPATNTK